jgi:hypothetical protein
VASLDETVIRHLCGCNGCCNPNHLKLGTQSQNQKDIGVHDLLSSVWEKNKIDYQGLQKILLNNKFDQF